MLRKQLDFLRSDVKSNFYLIWRASDSDSENNLKRYIDLFNVNTGLWQTELSNPGDMGYTLNRYFIFVNIINEYAISLTIRFGCSFSKEIPITSYNDDRLNIRISLRNIIADILDEILKYYNVDDIFAQDPINYINSSYPTALFMPALTRSWAGYPDTAIEGFDCTIDSNEITLSSPDQNFMNIYNNLFPDVAQTHTVYGIEACNLTAILSWYKPIFQVKKKVFN